MVNLQAAVKLDNSEAATNSWRKMMLTKTASTKQSRFLLLAATAITVALPASSRADDCIIALAPLMSLDSSYKVPFKLVYNRSDSRYVTAVVQGTLTPYFFSGASQLFGDWNQQLFSDRFAPCGYQCFAHQPF